MQFVIKWQYILKLKVFADTLASTYFLLLNVLRYFCGNTFQSELIC